MASCTQPDRQNLIKPEIVDMHVGDSKREMRGEFRDQHARARNGLTDVLTG
jgi:hypothetical protein